MASGRPFTLPNNPVELGRVVCVARTVYDVETLLREGRRADVEEPNEGELVELLYEEVTDGDMRHAVEALVKDTFGQEFGVIDVELAEGNSIELLVVIGAAYGVVVNFNQVMDALRQASENIRMIFHALLRNTTSPTGWITTSRWSIAMTAAQPWLPLVQTSPSLNRMATAISWKNVIYACILVTYFVLLIVGVIVLLRHV